MFRFLTRGVVLLLCFVSLYLHANEAPIIHPGAPGEAVNELTAEEAIAIADTSYSADDVRFLQDMIPHHHQAVVMSEMVNERTNRQEIKDVAGRITASQADEIKFMADWLRERGEAVPDDSDFHAMHTHHDMAGMASEEDLAELKSLTGSDFDRKFLTLMIAHHEGAVTMVEELLDLPGAAYDPILYEFTSDVTNDQESEIERMHAVLISLSDDPRAGLKAGFEDAGDAILNLKLIGSLTKPAGFFDPENPSEIPPEMPEDEEENEAGVAQVEGEDAPDKEEEEPEEYDRYPLLSFSNTDMAFRDDVLFAGSYHGFNIYQLYEEELPSLLSSVVCPGGQGDVSVVDNLLIMSVEQTRGRLDCGLDGVIEDASPDRFRGIRIFDISDLARPKQVGAVQTCRGSHTHSVVSADEEKIIVYNSGTSSVREEEEMEGCSDVPGDMRTALFRIDVIEIPRADPSKSRIVHSPAVFADPEKDTLAGLWTGGDHGDETQETSITDQCHDITVFPSKGLAAGACSGNGILFDISDPMNPQRLDAVLDTGFAYWHSATFNNAGTKVVFTDEWGGGGRPRCRAFDPLDWGADAIYDIVDNKLEFRSYFKMPAPQVEEENCVAHNGSIVPVPGRDIFVQAWYQGGMTLIDFSNTENPVEIAYFDRGPVNEEHLITGGYWSTYYYNGRIYGTEIVRGLDVFELTPSEHISEAEIAAAELASDGDIFNPQQQLQVKWPDHPIVAQAYIDQLGRADMIDESLAQKLKEALNTAAERLGRNKSDKKLSRRLAELAAGITATDTKSVEMIRIVKAVASDLR